MAALSNDWAEALSDEFKKPYYKDLYKYVKDEYSSHVVYPPSDAIFNALHYTSLKDTRVVILGQDPYHGPNQAHGLCYSVKEGIEPPPSLKNIFKEIESDIGIKMSGTGDLTPWAKQGILLLNTVLTVRQGQPNSHKGMGWEILTDKIISLLNERKEPIVFLLWGANARSKKNLISSPQHLILETVHPSPLSAYNGFFGCRHFSKTNDFLSKMGKKSINWLL